MACCAVSTVRVVGYGREELGVVSGSDNVSGGIVAVAVGEGVSIGSAQEARATIKMIRVMKRARGFMVGSPLS
jgi:hypothetical protein